MTPNLDALARLSARPKSSRRDEQPFRLRLDDLGRCLELPGPRALARTFDRADLHKGPAGILYRYDAAEEAATRLDLDALVDDVLAALIALPARPGASQAYADLRLALAHAEAAEVRLYIGKCVRALRTLVPEYRPPRAPRPEPTEEHKRDAARLRVKHFREKAAAEERASSEWWLRVRHGTHTPGTRVAAPVLWSAARADLSDLLDGTASEFWEDECTDDTAPERLRVPGRQTFYGEADRLYGKRTVGHRKTHHYTLPEVLLPDRDAFSEAILDRVARLAWDEQRALLLDYMARRDGRPEQATGTDGVVVDLAARRAAR